MGPEHVALFLVTALLAPTFRFSSDGKQFILALRALVEQKQDNLYSLLKLAFKDYTFLRQMDQIIIDLSSGNATIFYLDGRREMVLTKSIDLSKSGLRSFAILDRDHLKEIYLRLLQNEDKGGQVSSVSIDNGILVKQTSK